MLSLLRAAAEDQDDLPLAAFTNAKVQWAVETGLGPLLFRSTKAHHQAINAPLWPLVRAADLTARMLTSERYDALCEILDVCAGRVPPLLLLKGMSICDQHYPEPHLRLMRDIDFLVDEEAIPTVESLLHQLGYRQQSHKPPEFYATHHHRMPFFHPHRNIWVEVHQQLFPASSRVRTDRVFGLQHLKTQYRPAAFQGRQVNRLSDALQIVYIASHWATELKGIGAMVAMLDLIYLLKHTKDPDVWGQIGAWLLDSVAVVHLYLLLTYLNKYRLINIAPEILQALLVQQHAFGTVNLKLMHALIDRYIVDGKPFGYVRSLRHLDIIWQTCLLPGPPWHNLIRVPWHLFIASRLVRRPIAF
jgi:hypothetical protein